MFPDILQFTLQGIESGASTHRMAATYFTEKQSKRAENGPISEPTKNLNQPSFQFKKLKSKMR